MAFLDNSGDIILDAVLTDEGRRRLAMGDGSFRITKFALGDDEIDYSLYDKTPASGSGYEDTRILQLPVFEAFTNNTTSLKNRVLSYADNSLLYLPVVKLNNLFSPTTTDAAGPVGGYYVSVDSTTTAQIESLDSTAAASSGYRFAQAGASVDQSRLIFDQGLDTADLSLGYLSPAEGGNSQEQDLFESSYLVEVDNRLLGLTTPTDLSMATPSFIDDDNIATYYLSLGTDPEFVVSNNAGAAQSASESVAGPRGTTLSFKVNASIDLNSSTFLFTELGSEYDIASGTTVTYYFIDTTIRVTGATTGYRIDIPIRYVKYKS